VSYQNITKEIVEDLLNRCSDLRKYHFLGGVSQFSYLRCAAENSKMFDDEYGRYVDTMEQIYNDNSRNKPSYPGEYPHYRDRRYIVNW